MPDAETPITAVTGDRNLKITRTDQIFRHRSNVVKISVCALIVGIPKIVGLDNQNPDAAKIPALEKEWYEVYKRSDVARMDELLADDYIITIEGGRS